MSRNGRRRGAPDGRQIAPAGFCESLRAFRCRGVDGGVSFGVRGAQASGRRDTWPTGFAALSGATTARQTVRQLSARSGPHDFNALGCTDRLCSTRLECSNIALQDANEFALKIVQWKRSAFKKQLPYNTHNETRDDESRFLGYLEPRGKVVADLVREGA